MADKIEILRTELTTDPLVRGYAGMTTAQKITSLNAVDRTLAVDTVTGAEIYNAVNQAEFDALSAVEMAQVDRITALGDEISVADSGRARNTLLSLFAGGTTTRTNLAALKTRAVSRAVELGIGIVGVGFIELAEA